jgi:6-phosphogluconolactonase
MSRIASFALAVTLFATVRSSGRVVGEAAPVERRAMVYASVGAELAQYEPDIAAGTLIKRGAVTLPGYVQEAWRHPSKGILYVAWSNGGALYPTLPNGAARPATMSGVTAFAIDSASGALRPLGEPAMLRSRPIYITCDIACTHLLAAYNEPSGISVHDVRGDGTIGAEVVQSALDVGVYAHQVRVSPSNRTVVVPTRGNEPAAGRPEDPGAVKIFRYQDGLLTNLQSLAPPGGLGFRSRHVDFHPTRPWMFLVLEAQNKLEVYRRLDDDRMQAEPSFVVDTLAAPAKSAARQTASSIHMHPSGRVIFVANRAAGTGGENSVAVFAIDEKTGAPTRIQNVDTQGTLPRTFAIDPTGRMLIVANQTSANLAVFRIGGDGRLIFARSYDSKAGSLPLLWVGIVPI